MTKLDNQIPKKPKRENWAEQIEAMLKSGNEEAIDIEFLDDIEVEDWVW